MNTALETKVRLKNELAHGEKLVKEGAEDIWNWASPTGKVRADRRAKIFADEGRLSASSKVLEIGCGTGLFTRKVCALTNADITATDLSAELLVIARKSLPKGRFEIADAMALPYADNTFDVVFGSSILHHLEFDPALREMFRVLQSGGRMVFAEPNMLNPQIFLQKNIPFLKKMLGDSPDETAIVRWSFARHMESVGFKNIKITPYDFLHPITPVRLIPFVDRLGKIIERVPLIREIAGSVVIYGEK